MNDIITTANINKSFELEQIRTHSPAFVHEGPGSVPSMFQDELPANHKHLNHLRDHKPLVSNRNPHQNPTF